MSQPIKNFLSAAPPAGRYVCPTCQGGRTKEQSLQVYDNPEGKSAVCFRDQCGAKFFMPADPENRAKARVTAPKGRDPYREPEIQTFNDGDVEALWQKWYLEAIELAWWGWRRFLGAPRVLYIPLWRQPLDPKGLPEFDGHVERVVDPDGTGPKARTRLRPEVGQRGVYLAARDRLGSKYVVVVEDMLSAAALRAEKVDAVALLGTAMNREQLHVLRNWGKPIIFALDADATRSAIALTQRLQGTADTRIIRLEKDVKDMTPAERETFVKTCTTLCREE